MTLSKRIQPALAARAAMFSVALARRGLTGAHRALEGSAGYFRVYMNGNVCAPEDLVADYGWFQIERLVIKRWTSCGACHTLQAAAERLVREENPHPADIARVELFGCGYGGLVSGDFKIGNNPQVDAQFCVAYGVALALLRGPATLAHYTNEAVRADIEVAALAARVTHVETPDDMPPRGEKPTDYPDWSTRYEGVIVTLKDGRRLTRIQQPIDILGPGLVTFETVVGKFRDCAEFSGVCPPDRAAAIIETVRRLDSQPSLACLMEHLTLPRTGG